MKEIERRWLLKEFPRWEEIKDYFENQFIIVQHYEKEYKFRIRRIAGADGYKYYKTIKRGEGLVREEIENEISYDDYIKLYNEPNVEYVIEKRRLVLKENDIHIYLDDLYYIDKYFCEVEFPTEQDALRYVLPEFLSKYAIEEVTNDKSQSNFELAKKHMIDKNR